jgi:glycosyltransferase involved in cell wall biosynthesis
MMKKVSVIITTFNSEQTIEKTIQSILYQEGVNREFELELIVVDDCSVDNTRDLTKKYDLRLLSTDYNSGGPNKGRNIGLKNATGDYLCIADHDDVWQKHMIVAVLPYLLKVPIVSTGYTVVDQLNNRNIKRVGSTKKSYLYFAKNRTFIDRLTRSLKGQNAYLGSIFFRSELKNNYFEEHFNQVDYDWVLRLFHNNDSIEVCKSLYYRYVSGCNLSLNETYRRIDFYYSLMALETYEEQYPAQVRKAYHRIHGSRARYFYLIGNMKKARFYFLKSSWGIKTLMYYITSFVGSQFVKRKFNIFG